MVSIQDYESLLKQVAEISARNDKRLEELKKRGELFNLFSVLKIDSDEVKHSAFLAVLLNPNANHGLNGLFLKEFSKITKLNLDDFALSNAKITTEKDIGLKSSDNSESGRIDIFIEGRFSDNRTFGIVIENKIYAGDQPKQLKRYKDFLNKQKYDMSRIFYLTLDGHLPSQYSADNLKETDDFECISYKAEIKIWIEKCVELSARQASVRESLIQYSNLIDKLANKKGDNTMDEELMNLLLTDNNLELAAALCNKLEDARKNFLTQKFPEILIKFCPEDMKVYSEASSIDFSDKKDQDSWFFGNYLKENLDFNIWFGFNRLEKNCQSIAFVCYLEAKNDEKRNLSDKMKSQLKDISAKFHSDWGNIVWEAELTGHNNVDKLISSEEERNAFGNDLKNLIERIKDSCENV